MSDWTEELSDVLNELFPKKYHPNVFRTIKYIYDIRRHRTHKEQCMNCSGDLFMRTFDITTTSPTTSELTWEKMFRAFLWRETLFDLHYNTVLRTQS